MTEKQKKTDCQFFKRGKGFCRNKDKCRFAHIDQFGNAFSYAQAEAESESSEESIDSSYYAYEGHYYMHYHVDEDLIESDDEEIIRERYQF